MPVFRVGVDRLAAILSSFVQEKEAKRLLERDAFNPKRFLFCHSPQEPGFDRLAAILSSFSVEKEAKRLLFILVLSSDERVYHSKINKSFLVLFYKKEQKPLNLLHPIAASRLVPPQSGIRFRLTAPRSICFGAVL